MDNQDSTPQLIIPNVPDDFCPVGDWRSILQTYQDVVLSNGTVDIPGLSDLSPETISQLESDVNNLQSDVTAINANITTINTNITNLQTSLASLTSRVAALEAIKVVTVRTGVVSISSGTGSYAISFAALPSTSYGVVITPRGNATTSAAGKYVLDDSGQTTTGFTILVNDNPATVTSLRWTAIHTE